MSRCLYKDGCFLGKALGARLRTDRLRGLEGPLIRIPPSTLFEFCTTPPGRCSTLSFVSRYLLSPNRFFTTTSVSVCQCEAAGTGSATGGGQLRRS